MDSLEQLECWLIRVAGRKFNEALRRSAREAAHAPNVYLANHESYRLAELGQQASREVVEELECSLHDDTDRAVFRGKLNELTEAQIARQLRCSTRKIRGVWQRVRQRLSRCL
jgi:DNA-directed RNA polymerase specialized sigma24 family protein